jgi:hypothetical protein
MIGAPTHPSLSTFPVNPMKSKLLLVLVVTAGFVRLAAASDPVTIGASQGARQPQLAIDGRDGIHLAFGSEGGIYYSQSTDRGATFSDPVRVAQLKALSLGMRRGPRLAVTKDAIVISAIGGSLGGGRDGNLVAWRSTDHGQSWQGQVQINDTTASAREGLHAMAASPNGDVYSVWLDLRNKRTQLIGSRSTDGGATWSDNVLVYESPDGSICECCHPSAAYGDSDALYVLWRNSLAGNRDMYWTKSTDGGRTFGQAVKLGQQSWHLDACPMDGGAIAIGPDRQPATVWRRDKEVFISTKPLAVEQSLGRGLQPWLAANKEGLYTVWLSARPGNLFIIAPGRAYPTKLATGARDPVISASPSPSGPVAVAWETDENGRSTIKIKSLGAGP